MSYTYVFALKRQTLSLNPPSIDSFRSFLGLIYAYVERFGITCAKINRCQKLWPVFVKMILINYKYKLEMFLS